MSGPTIAQQYRTAAARLATLTRTPEEAARATAAITAAQKRVINFARQQRQLEMAVASTTTPLTMPAAKSSPFNRMVALSKSKLWLVGGGVAAVGLLVALLLRGKK